MTICHIWKVFHELTKEDCCHGIDKRCHNGRSDNGRRIHAAVLFAVGKDANGNELEGRDVNDKESTHFIACNMCRVSSVNF